MPTVRVELPAVGRQVGVELRPAQVPAARHPQRVEHRGRVGEDARLLVGALVEPLDTHRRGQPLHGAGESAAAVVALDSGRARIAAQQQIGHQSLGYLHALARIDQIGDVDRPVRIDGIRHRAEVVVARVGRIGIIGAADDLSRQGVVFGELVAVEQSFAHGGTPLVHALETQRIERPLGVEQRRVVPCGPQRLARRTRIDRGGRGRFERFEIERQPAVGGHSFQILPHTQFDHRLALSQHPDQILFVPAREDQQLA